MAEYKGIKGFKVQSLASDPTLVEGQVWYNTTGNALKYQATATAWASGTVLGTAIYQSGGGGGTLTAGITMSGSTAAPATPNVTLKSQLYDGTSWSDANNVNTARYLSIGMGSQTAAVFAGGTGTPAETAASEDYDGTSWTTGNSLSRGVCRGMGSGGTQTAGFVVGGNSAIPTVGETEEYDGSCWTETADLNTVRGWPGATGTTTAGLCYGGLGPGPSLGGTAVTEEWNGSSWANSNNMNNNRREMGCCGTQTAAFGFGGIGPPSNQKKGVSETYDGTSWTEGDAMATARPSTTPSHSGSTTSAYAAGGDTGSSPTYNIVEEFSPGTVVKTVTVS